MKKEYRQRIDLLTKENKFKAIELWWMDACSSSARYNIEADLPAPGAIVKTVGLLVSESDDFYRVAQSASEYTPFWHPIDIPKAWILKKRVLK